jgi:hypothetical protein
MTDTATLNTVHDTETVEGLANLLRERLARGERPTQNGDSFSMFILMEAMNIVHDETLDQDMLALHVSSLRGILSGALSPLGLGSIPKNYLDAAYRVINREERIAEETGVPAPTFCIRSPKA